PRRTPKSRARNTSRRTRAGRVRRTFRNRRKEILMNTPLKIAAVLIATGALGACGHMSRADEGTAIGAVGGAAVGNAVTGGSALGTVAGAVGGGVLGHEIGEDRDRRRR